MTHVHRARVGASLCALAAAISAAAAAAAPVTPDAAAAADAEAERPVVVVTAPGSDAAVRTPGGADTVDAAAYEDRVAVSLRDTLAFSPGVYTQPRFGQEVRLSIRGSGLSRGYHMRGLLLLQDGIPINLADNNGDFQELDPQVFERIEAYRGGNALRLGGSTLGGAIDAVTPTGRTAPRAELRVDGGSYATLRTKAAVALSDDRGDVYAALTTDRSDGDRAHADRASLRFNGNVGLRLGDAVENRFYASVNHIRQDLPGALTRAQALTDPAQSLPANVAQDQERDIDSIRLQNRTTVTLGDGEIAFGGFLNDKQLFHPIFQVIDQASTDYGAFLHADWRGDWGGVPVALAAGSNARFGHVAARQFVNVAGRRGAPTADARQSARTIDSYAELRATPLAGLTVIVGGIQSHAQRQVANRLVPARSGRASFDAFSPKAGVLYEPVAGVQFYANANRSVEFPGYAELNQTPFASGGVVTPGFVDVAAQRAWTVEAGTRGSHGPVSWDVTAYRADLRGEILQFDQGVGVPAATFNAGRTRHQGIEAAVEIAPAAWIHLRQSYQLNDFRFRGDARYGDNRLPVVAQHLYRGELRLGDARASIAPAVEWVPRGAWADYANTTRAPGYALLGVGARATLDDRLLLFVDARNLTGKKAIGDISAVTRAAAGSAIYYPVERRAVYVGVRARL